MDPIAKMLGNYSVELNGYSILLRILLSVAFSAIIGWERSSKRHFAGLRTFMLVSLAMTMTMILDTYMTIQAACEFPILSCAAIIAVAIISGQSLLFSSRNQIKELTTSVGLWASGIVGLAIGGGYYTVALISFVALYFILSLVAVVERYLKNRSNHFEIHLELKSSGYLQNFVSTIRRLGMKIDDIEVNSAYVNSGLSVYSIAISISNQELKKYKTHTEIIEALQSLDYIYHIEEIGQ